MRVVPTEEGAELDLTGHTLVLPGLGLAHLGELCVDALITSFRLGRVALVQSRHLLPVAMASAWESPGAPNPTSSLTTAAEVYQGPGFLPLTILQLRSPVVEGKRRTLAKEIYEWAQTCGVAEIIVVSGCASYVKVDADLAANTDLRYALAGAGSMPAAVRAAVGAPLPLGHSLPRQQPHDDEQQPGEGDESAVPVAPVEDVEDRHLEAAERMLRGGGLARPLLQAAADAAEAKAGTVVPGALCLLGLTAEVAPWPLTEQLTRSACACIAEKIGAPAPQLQVPPSWRIEAASAGRRLWG